MNVTRNATMTFGLVNVPVGLATVASEQKVEFRLLHRDCRTPSSNKPYCKTCERVTEPEELVRAFEYAKEQFLTIEEDELAGLFPERDPVIRLSKFVPAVELQPLQVQKTYYLLPNKAFARQYRLLEETISSTSLISIGSHNLWGKEAPCAISSVDGVLWFQILWCADELKDSSDALDNLDGAKPVTEQELALAKDIVMAMSGSLEPEDLRSPAHDQLAAFINDKLSGNELVEAQDEERLLANVDLLASLKASVAATRKPAAKRKPRAKVKS